MRYIELLKKSLLNELHLGAEVAYFHARECLEGKAIFDERVVLDPEGVVPALFGEAVQARNEGRLLGRSIRNIGFAHTMIGRQRLDHLDACVRSVIDGSGWPIRSRDFPNRSSTKMRISTSARNRIRSLRFPSRR